MIANDKPTFDKAWAFKLALVNKFGRNTFAEFIFALRQEMDRLSMKAEKLTVYGVDCRDRKFSFNVESFNVEHDNTCIELRVYYKWDASEDRPSNWHWQTLVMTETSYVRYMRDADLVYKKDKSHDDAFEQWKKDHPSTYEILFSLLLRWADTCMDIHGYDKVAHMWQHHTNSTKRWSPVSLHVTKHVTQYRIEKIYLNSIARTFAIEAELDFINGMGEVVRGHYTSDFIEEDTVCDIEDEVMKYLTGKSDEDKPTYKKPGVTYQHVSTAKPGSTETQKVVERLLKNSFYGMNAISPLDGKPHIDIGDGPCWDVINPDLNRKVIEYVESDAEAVATYYEALNKEKETKEMKKLIINHDAVIVLFGVKDSYGKEKKTVVKILDPDTKEERGPWNTKLAVVSAIAKSFEHARDGKHSTCYKLYEMLNTIKKPTNATIDFVADEMHQNGKRLKNFKWYQEAINVKRPAPGKSVVIIMEDK